VWVFSLLCDSDRAQAKVQILVDGFQGSFDANIIFKLDYDCLTLEGLEKGVEELDWGRGEGVRADSMP
jgi:hypothetical protein